MRRGCRQGQWAALCPTETWGALAPPLCCWTPSGISPDPFSTPRKALILQSLLDEGFSLRGSSGAESHSLSQCQVSPEDSPQIGVFPARIFALGEKVVWSLNLVWRGWAVCKATVSDAASMTLPFSCSCLFWAPLGCCQQWRLSQSSQLCLEKKIPPLPEVFWLC